MKFTPSAFKYDRAEVTLLDVLKLLVGKEIKDGTLKIKLWGMPKQI